MHPDSHFTFKDLQQRFKLRTPQPGFSINDVVLVKDGSLPPLKWPLARVLELISGSEGSLVEDWSDFSNMFTTVIDKDPYLTNIEKLQHLRSCLKGTALNTIRSLEMSNANYATALELLDKRFNNKRLVFEAHINENLRLRKVDKGATTQLSEFSDKVNSHLLALKSMGSVEQIAGSIIVHILLQKLDSATQANVIPSCGRLTAFIEKRCQSLENADHATAMYTPGSQVGQNNSGRRTFVLTSRNLLSHKILAATSSSTLSIDQHLKHDVILLATAVINVKNYAGSLVPCRTLLESGSQLHIITSRLAHQLQLRKFNSTAVLSGVGDAAFSSNDFSQDMLIGGSLFFYLLCVGQIKLTSGLPILQKTRFGWVATGGAPHAGKSSLVARRFLMNADLLVDSHLQTNAQIDEIIRRLWELESVTARHTFRPNGEYSVRLPLRLSLDQLGDSYQQALRRFLILERKLGRNPTLKTQYATFIKEYPDLNHMSLVSLAALGQCKYYLPHHCVLKSYHPTETVFDTDAFTYIRNRPHRRHMQNVSMRTSRTYLHGILCRYSQHQKLQTYKVDTVTYGTKPASLLSVRAMHQLAMDEQKAFPIGADIIKRDFYVDDLISGGGCVQEAVEILKQTSGLLAKGNFKLRKPVSGYATVLQSISDEDRESLLKFNDGSDITKKLGLVWDPVSDCFLFSFSPLRLASRLTKRSILSSTARFYDSLGLVGPVITKSKIFMLDLWREKLDWDESLPVHLSTAWVNFFADFEQTQQFQYPRRATSSDSTVEIHGFCDASLSAYGACVYTVSKCHGNTSVRILCSKSRVAPVKTITVPKLKLCGAALLAELPSEICQLNVFHCRYYC
ncbi:uncharacterized protein [Drosophila virilis]|uniref:uncharacterized protein n=1 Tax=Drosophila virilis TaxID=7244 RepID=UPI0038B3A4E1